MGNVHGKLTLQEEMSDSFENEGLCIHGTIKMERTDIASNRHFYWEKNGVWFDPAEKHVDTKSSVILKPRRLR